MDEAICAVTDQSDIVFGVRSVGIDSVDGDIGSPAVAALGVAFVVGPCEGQVADGAETVLLFEEFDKDVGGKVSIERDGSLFGFSE